MQAVILASGKGKRLEPFTITRPKVIFPIANKPVLAHIVDGLVNAGISNIIVITGRDDLRIKNYFSGYKLPCSKLQGIPSGKFVLRHDTPQQDCGVFRSQNKKSKLEFLKDEEAYGTASSLLKAKDRIKGNFLLVYGDIYTTHENFKMMMESPPLSVGVCTHIELSKGMGAKVEKGKFTSFSLKARWEEETSATHAIAGIFHLDKRVFPYLENNPGYFSRVPPGVEAPMEAEFLQSLHEMTKEFPIKAVPLKEPLVDIDMPWQILDANNEALYEIDRSTKKSKISSSAKINTKHYERLIADEGSVIEEGVRLTGCVYTGKNTVIHAGTHIYGPTIIGDNCRIGPHAWIANSSIGNEVHIGHCAEIYGVILDKVYCMHYSYISGVIGENTNLGAATVCGTLRHDEKEILMRIGARLESTGKRGLGCFIGDYCRTGVNTMIMSGKKIGPFSAAGAGVLVSQDLPPHKLVVLNQDLKTYDW